MAFQVTSNTSTGFSISLAGSPTVIWGKIKLSGTFVDIIDKKFKVSGAFASAVGYKIKIGGVFVDLV
jgi:hypothetical protein